jgi:hypothetical protein
LLRDLPADPEPYRRERMTWFALEQSDPLLGHAMRWVRDGQAELVVEHDGIRVVRLR